MKLMKINKTKQRCPPVIAFIRMLPGLFVKMRESRRDACPHLNLPAALVIAELGYVV